MAGRMNSELVDKIARAILYEGYILYPYRQSSLKNQQRWNFGVLYPPAWTAMQTGSDRSHFQMECIVLAGKNSRLEAAMRFLHLMARSEGDGVWQEASEREVLITDIGLADIVAAPIVQTFSFAGSEREQDGIVRKQEFIRGEIELSAICVRDAIFRVTVRLRNTTALPARDRNNIDRNNIDRNDADRNKALMGSLASAHTVLTIREGEFVSQTDPPDALREATAACRNVGVWPVLVGEDGARDTVLGSPIILYDYPQVAPESAGDLFDATEIDEILTLRILTLTDDEKQEIRRSDERARRILDRAEANPAEHVAQLHGAIRGMRRITESEGSLAATTREE